jgi:hypothetical protein
MENKITYNSVQDLADAMKRAEAAHAVYEKTKTQGEKMPWPEFYANIMASEQKS